MSETFFLMVFAGFASFVLAIVWVVMQVPMGLMTVPAAILFLGAACMEAFSQLVRIEQ